MPVVSLHKYLLALCVYSRHRTADALVPMPSHVLCLNLSFYQIPVQNHAISPYLFNRIWSNAWTNILVIFFVNFLAVFVYVFLECVLNVVFFAFVLVVYLYLFSVVCDNKGLNTTVDLCLHSPHHMYNKHQMLNSENCLSRLF